MRQACAVQVGGVVTVASKQASVRFSWLAFGKSDGDVCS
jgi:hypothetical protein